MGKLGHPGDNQADLYRAAMTTKDGARNPTWKYPATFDMEGKGGYWHGAAIQRMGREVDKTGYKSALPEILLGRGENTNNERASVKPKGETKGGANQYGGIARRHYPAGKGLSESERCLAMTHGPVAKDKKGIWWDFIAHCGCSR